jgi:hypothetical protein
MTRCNMNLPYKLLPLDASRDGHLFTEENDHNPMIHVDCPLCDGTGKELAGNNDVCPICEGSGRKAISYFKNDNPPIIGKVNSKGDCKCPSCGFIFTITNPRSWTGKRHARCGQKLILNEKANQVIDPTRCARWS